MSFGQLITMQLQIVLLVLVFLRIETFPTALCHKQDVHSSDLFILREQHIFFSLCLRAIVCCAAADTGVAQCQMARTALDDTVLSPGVCLVSREPTCMT